MEETAKKSGLKAVNPMLLLVVILLITAAASYVVPAGTYDRVFLKCRRASRMASSFSDWHFAIIAYTFSACKFI